jgi:murein DD-endopeptidase MepM/ murein hydrolase activator NlpD
MAGHRRGVAAGVFLVVALTAAPQRLSPGPSRPGPHIPRTAMPPAVLHLRLAALPASVNVPLHPGPVEPSAARTHVVARGDTLWAIARHAALSVAALAAVNHLAPAAVLRPGQVLVIPSAQAAEPSRARRARMLWPTSGKITSRFGWRIHPIFGTREFHPGVDIATRWGAPVLAARAGIVRFVGWMTGYGRLIIVDHGHGLETFYSHLSAALVADGQHVASGEIIGRIGSTGWSTGPHLLFEVRKNGVPQDPARYLR